jgi:hypothetical protein
LALLLQSEPKVQLRELAGSLTVVDQPQSLEAFGCAQVCLRGSKVPL